jgi:hypothetical protein
MVEAIQRFSQARSSARHGGVRKGAAEPVTTEIHHEKAFCARALGVHAACAFVARDRAEAIAACRSHHDFCAGSRKLFITSSNR